jgi:lipopolysaccharide export system ATP-binding protein
VQPSRNGAAKGAPPAPAKGRGAPGGATQDSGKMPSMLEQDQPVNATSAKMDYDGAAGLATYTGQAKLWQEKTQVQGDVIVVDDKSGNLTARGHVRTVMVLDEVDTATKKKQAMQTTATGDVLVYEEARRVATYTTGATAKAHLVGSQGDVTADRIELFMKEGTKELERAEADGNVTVIEGVRTATGRHLIYTPANQTYVMTGTPVQVVEKTPKECRISDATTLTFRKDAEAMTMENNRYAPVKFEELTKSYGGRTVVRGVNLDISSGEVVGLLGPNGAGKTTTFSMVVGLVSPDSGRVLLDGADVTEDPMYIRARRGIGYLPQEASIFRGLTVEQNLLAILETLDLDSGARYRRMRELLAELGLTPLAKAPAFTLSGGERRRVEITRALVLSPQFMLLDEPFAGIDPIAVTDIQKIIFHLKSRGIGVLITDHNVRETLRITDRAYIVHDGVIFRSGTPGSLAADDEVKRIYLGADFRLD